MKQTNVRGHTRRVRGKQVFIKPHSAKRRAGRRKLILGGPDRMPKTKWLRDWESGPGEARVQVRAAIVGLLKERVAKVPGVTWRAVKAAANKVAEEAVEKLNWRKTVRELRELGMKHGPRFMAYAIALEIFEDVVLPAFFIAIGKPELAPVALAFHAEPVAYPAYFAIAKLVERFKESSDAQKAQMYVKLA